MEFDAVVCGGGAIGLALAREISFELGNVLLIEQKSLLGSETSSRNSEVIHAGLYYKTDSLKHLHCINGKALLYDFLQKYDIDHHKVGKLIVACDGNDQTKLANLYNQACQNNVEGLIQLDRADLRRLEPELNCIEGFISKSTGIFDSHSFLQALIFEAEQNGVTIVTNHSFSRAEIQDGKIQIQLKNLENDKIYTKRFYNCAGLHAIEVMQHCHISDPKHRYRYQYAKGNYFSLSGASPFQHLIYPIPEKGGLGIHSTIDCNGKTRFGPNVEWTDLSINELQQNYEVSPVLADTFKTAIQRYWPGVKDRTLTADYSGFRPKLFEDEVLNDDFKIIRDFEIGGCEIVHFLGIESPGLTSCLSLVKHISEK